jgi:hypothetical protein
VTVWSEAPIVTASASLSKSTDDVVAPDASDSSPQHRVPNGRPVSTTTVAPAASWTDSSTSVSVPPESRSRTQVTSTVYRAAPNSDPAPPVTTFVT